ncbi:TPA: hypothetical protein DCL30_00555 [Candidatus Peribacteria bacterium]|nr:MAG: hypothetical protein A3J91_04700 [Candidatus Peribacteria bacterium RIFOXYC2_FULL_58_10]OGJ84451.1 MAG: hypothetical protein A2529_03620 [Candidatus Peribacteria bacterium RIFOXYD2_FULL_58_15]HAI98020.1 hypothetical protein [Candidatus Peribacteria bacterium]HAS34614.1 hypothetical protein [Candidatus Peribacteria bacterium]
MPRIPSIVGHADQIAQLQVDLAAGNVAHAYLFSGSRHLGKMTTARWFALQLLCDGVAPELHEQVSGQVERLVHPDLLVLDQLWMEGTCEDWEVIARSSNAPQQERAKNGVKTDTISIDDVRALQERLYETGTSKWRCCIIRSIERMQDPAANAFLKILEEPPLGLVFLLTTQAFPSLLPTVISRSRVLHFHRLPSRDIAELLGGMTEDDVHFILHLAQGVPGIALQLKESPDALRAQRLMHSKAQSFWRSKSLRERMQLLAPVHERGEEAQLFLMHLALTLREQMPKAPMMYSHALTDLIRGLGTNAHRQLIAQRFALQVTV